MAACASMFACLIWVVGIFVLVSPVPLSDQNIITAEPGQNVTLKCRAPDNNSMIVECGGADLGDKYFFVYRYGKIESEHQYPSFKNRVDLQDRQMKDGDVSLILKNVTINDTGTYKCRVMNETLSWKNICTINLTVAPPGQPGGTTEDGVSSEHAGPHALLLWFIFIANFCLLFGSH